MTDVHSRSHPGGTATPHSPPPLKVDLGKLSASAERELMAVLGSSLEAEMQ